jgi:hypothetical protein
MMPPLSPGLILHWGGLWGPHRRVRIWKLAGVTRAVPTRMPAPGGFARGRLLLIESIGH